MRSVTRLVAGLIPVLLAGGPAARAQQIVDWTVMVYLDGDTPAGQENLENATISDFNELEQVGSSNNLNVVVQWDRGPATDLLDTYYGGDERQSWETTRRYLVNADPDQAGQDPNELEPDPAVAPRSGYTIASPMLLDLGELDMGQENTLVDFATWTMSHFPARNYLLVLNGPGRGWQPRSRASMFDATAPGQDDESGVLNYLSNSELRSALSRIKTANGGRNLRACVLDSGGMAILEMAYELRGLTDYLVAPWLERPLDGFPYDALLNRLGTNPLTDGALEQVLTGWAGDFAAGYTAGTNLLGGAQSTAVGVYRMAQVEAVATAADELAGALLADLPQFSPGLFRALMQVQAGRPRDFTGTSIDLRHFATLVANEIDDSAVDQAAAAVGPAVAALVANANPGLTVAPDWNVDEFRGLGIYFPSDVSRFDPTYALANDLAEDTRWDELVQGLLSLYSDQNPPQITISSPLSGSTIIENPPQIVISIVDQDAGGRVNPASVTLTLDGNTVNAAAYTYDPVSGILIYQIPQPLSVTSHTFTVSARDLSGNLATATGNFRIAVPTLPAGIQTFSLPRRILTDAERDPALIFGRDNYSLVRWVPSLFGGTKYRSFPDSFASFLPPDAAAGLNRPSVGQAPAGLGYWVRLRQARPVTALPGVAVNQNPYPLVLSANPDGGAGWTMIANPFDVSAVGLAAAQVQLADGNVITFSQAIERRITPGVLFTYVPNSANPNATGRYDFQPAGQGQLTRLQAHWLRANSDFVMLLSDGSRAVTEEPAPWVDRSSGPSDGWQLAVRIEAGDAGWDEVLVGASRSTSDGYDPTWDVASPPPLPGGVALRSVHTDWGREQGRYLRDIRGAGAGAVWDLELQAPAGEMTLSWPNLRELPADLQLTLTDPTTGQSRSLRHRGSWPVSHAGGTRLYTLTATRATNGVLTLGDVTLTRGRGAGYGIGYSLSQAAEVVAVVRSLGGQAVASVSAAGVAGRGQVYWDGRTADGRPIPNGIYRLEVIATGPDGATTRQVRVVQVMR